MRVMVADDDQISRTILRSMVQKAGFTVVEAKDGLQAWDLMNQEDPPRIALIDWIMPGLDGIAVCDRLQSRSEGAPFIYTIIMTATTEKEKLLEALRSGAHDFQYKPVDSNEINCRLAVARRLVEADDKLRAFGQQMEALAEERAKQLAHADRLATLGTLSAGIAHEINNPIGFISGNVQTQQMMWPIVVSALEFSRTHGFSQSEKLDFILGEMPGTMAGIRDGVQRVSTIVRDLKTFARRDEVAPPELMSLAQALEESLNLCHNQLKYNIQVIKEIPDALPWIRAIPQRITQVLVNLIANAADALESVSDATLWIQACIDGKQITLTIADNGPGIPPSVREQIFNPFFTTKPVGKGTGLGLSISQSIVQDFGGSLSAEERNGGGALFRIVFPVNVGNP